MLDHDPLNAVMVRLADDHLFETGLWGGIMWSIIFSSGYDAHCDGLPRGTNPFPAHSQEGREAWFKGWDQAAADEAERVGSDLSDREVR